MKRILSLILVSLMLITTLTSCNNEIDTDRDTDTENIIDTSKDTNSQIIDTGADINTNSDIINDIEPDNKDEVMANNVTTSEIDTVGDYYTRVNYNLVNEPNVLPNKLAYNEAYFKMFNSLDELRKYVDTKVTESTFRDNYVVLIESVFTIGGSEYEDLIGYYDFKCENGKYSISKDYSYSTGNNHMLEMNAKYDYHLDIILVPKNEIEFTEDIHELDIDRVKRNKEAFFYAKPTENTPLPTEPTAFIVNRERAEQMELKVSSYGSDDGYKGEVLILYMPEQKMSNLAITKCEIENGNLYITIEKYDETDENVIIPIEHDDVIFYEIYCDTDKLSENFEVHLTLYNVWVRNIPKPQNEQANYKKILTEEQRSLLTNALMKNYSNYSYSQDLFAIKKDGSVLYGSYLSKNVNGLSYVAQVVGRPNESWGNSVAEKFRYHDYNNMQYYELEKDGWKKYDGRLLEESVFQGIAFGNIVKDINNIRFDTRIGAQYYYLEKTSDHTNYNKVIIKLDGENLKSISLYTNGSWDSIESEYIEIRYFDIGTTKVELPCLNSTEINNEKARIGVQVARWITKTHYLETVGVDNINALEIASLNDRKTFERPDKDKYWYVEAVEWKPTPGPTDDAYGELYIYKIDFYGNIIEISNNY